MSPFRFSEVSDVSTPRVGRGVLAVLRNVWETAKVFLVSLAIIIPLRAYVVQPFFVRGSSMAPTFENNEYLVIEELTYHVGLRPPQRGDVVVFRYPLDPSQYFIKRIIGLPGERVRIKNGSVTIVSLDFPQGVSLDESPYLSEGERTEGALDVTLKRDEVFLLGDNRNHSSDSRSWGPLSEDLLVGRALLRAFPFRRFGLVQTPWYGFLATAAEATNLVP